MIEQAQVFIGCVFLRALNASAWRLAITCLFALFVTGNTYAQDFAGSARDVEVRVFLIDVENVDTVAQNFTANLTMVTRWQDPALVHDGPVSISMPLDDIWYPKLQIINQQRLVSTLPNQVEVYPDGRVVRRQRLWGGFSQPLDLHDFPFDAQSLTLTIVNVAIAGIPVNLMPSEATSVSDDLTIPDWTVTDWDVSTTNFDLEGEPDGIEGLVFSLHVERDKAFFKYKVIFPLVLIVMMSWLVFWIDPTLAASQISVSVTAMLTMIAYRFALAGMIPRLSFLTSLDYFVLVSTVVVFLSMIEVIYTAHLSASGNPEMARKVDRHARWIAPLIYFTAAAETLLFRFLV